MEIAVARSLEPPDDFPRERIELQYAAGFAEPSDPPDQIKDLVGLAVTRTVVTQRLLVEGLAQAKAL